jgi:hypothetical protein
MHHHHLKVMVADFRLRLLKAAIISLIWPILSDPERHRTSQSGRKNTQRRFSVLSVLNALLGRITYAPISEPTRMSDHSFVRCVGKPLRDSTTGRDTKVYTLARRNSSAVANCPGPVNGAVDGALPVQTLWAVISGPRLAESVLSHSSTKKQTRGIET